MYPGVYFCRNITTCSRRFQKTRYKLFLPCVSKRVHFTLLKLKRYFHTWRGRQENSKKFLSCHYVLSDLANSLLKKSWLLRRIMYLFYMAARILSVFGRGPTNSWFWTLLLSIHRVGIQCISRIIWLSYGRILSVVRVLRWAFTQALKSYISRSL